MIYYDKQAEEFKAHTLKATYFNEQDDTERVKYDSSKTYWKNFVAKWEHCKNLKWSNVTLTQQQQERLDALNQQENCCGTFDAQASIFVEHGAIIPSDAPPYLESIAGDYIPETLAWAENKYGQEFSDINELSSYLAAGES